MDLERKQFTKEIAGEILTLEVSKIAEQTNGAVLATYGDTAVLATVVMEETDTDRDYMPLSVDYEEKFYAAGKIPGGFFRREGRPSTDAILSGRLIDRTIRPLFDKRIRRPIQVVVTVLSYDGENDPDFVALTAVSTALGISDIPWGGPVAGVAVADVDGNLAVNPTKSALGGDTKLESFFAGIGDRINMIELGGDRVSEQKVAEAAREAGRLIKELTAFQEEIISQIGKPKAELDLKEPPKKLEEAVRKFLEGKLEGAIYAHEKQERNEGVDALREELILHLAKGEFDEDIEFAGELFEKVLSEVVRKNILESGRRSDGRAFDEVRDLHAETGLLPRTHGSALFVRGSTQALGLVTLGSPRDGQLLDTLETAGKKRFMLHYNFPPFSVGEARSFRGPGRRDIGHGALAEKAIEPLIPRVETFPYTIRVVSEILSSNGSSSMASVSAASLSLMDAGVPIIEPAAGISIGLVMESDDNYKLLTDIQGIEDFYGDMDFKVAGTRSGITAIQVDVKVRGLTTQMIERILGEAQKGRLRVLDVTDKVLAAPRPELSPFAPRIISLTIDPEKIGEVIGPGGKVINGIIEDTGVSSIDIDEDGTVFITSLDAAAAARAREIVEAIVSDLEPGEIIEGTVAKLLDFGAVVEFPGGKSGLIHVSELKDEFVKDVKSVLSEGDTVRVKVLKIENGKTSLSLKQANRESH